METFKQQSDPNQFGSRQGEEIILASARPKKRAGRTVFKETRHPVYRGVRSRNMNKWVCEVRVPNSKTSRLWLGTYPTAEMAARAHDVAALALRGKSACLNFADSAWRLPVPASNDVEEIRRVAIEVAGAFGQTQENYYSNGYGDVSGTCIGEEEETVTTVGTSKLDEDDLGFGLYVHDEDATYGLNSLLESMAEGPLWSPPPCPRDDRDWSDLEHDAEVSLWSFSI